STKVGGGSPDRAVEVAPASRATPERGWMGPSDDPVRPGGADERSRVFRRGSAARGGRHRAGGRVPRPVDGDVAEPGGGIRGVRPAGGGGRGDGHPGGGGALHLRRRPGARRGR